MKINGRNNFWSSCYCLKMRIKEFFMSKHGTLIALNCEWIKPWTLSINQRLNYWRGSGDKLMKDFIQLLFKLFLSFNLQVKLSSFFTSLPFWDRLDVSTIATFLLFSFMKFTNRIFCDIAINSTRLTFLELNWIFFSLPFHSLDSMWMKQLFLL